MRLVSAAVEKLGKIPDGGGWRYLGPYRPQANGKIERFHRTLAEGWAFKKFYNSESARLAALPGWVHEYNHHRPHSAIGKATPITRLNNLAGHHS